MSRKNLLLGGGVLIALALVLVIYVLFFQTETHTVTLEDFSWQYSIIIEDFQARQSSAWCKYMSPDAYNVTRVRERSGSRTVCTGTRKNRICRQEPEYDNRCYYTVDSLKIARTVSTEGAHRNDPPPYWPEFELAQAGDDGYGEEREGRHIEYYAVGIVWDDGEREECEVPRDWWDEAEIDSVWQIEVRRTGDTFACNEIEELEGF